MSEAEQKLRVFVALAVPAAVKARLAATQQELRDQLPRHAASWTRTENTHLTLRFLGDMESIQVKALASSLAAAISGFGPLYLVAERLGCFPDLRSPRVVWAWVHDAADRLPDLQQRIVAATAGFTPEPAEKRFVGHLTLARTKQIKRPQAQIVASYVQGAVHRSFGEWTADRIEVMRSELSPDGSRYTCLAELPLS